MAKVGRPSKMDELAVKVFVLCRKGLTDKEISQVLDIDEGTINNWKKNPEFFKSLKENKLKADEIVELSLFQRATGYEYDEVVYEKSKTGGLSLKGTRDAEGKIDIEEFGHTDTHIVKVTKKHVLPDVTACIFWLKNRQPEQWRDETHTKTTEEKKLEVVHKIKGLSTDDLRSIINVGRNRALPPGTLRAGEIREALHKDQER